MIQLQAQHSLALGRSAPKKGVALAVVPRTLDERVALLEAMVKNLQLINDDLMREKSGGESNAYSDSFNRQGIPLGTCLIGTVRGTAPRVLTVTKDGYFVGKTQFASLSAAAEAVSGITRKSGWVFWKLADGRTVKEAFKNR
jgi:hypothetical protein